MADSIERFTAGSRGVLWGYGKGEWVRYSDHERIVRDLEAHIAERDALLSPGAVDSRKALVEALQFALRESGCDGDLCNYRWHEKARAALALAEKES